MGNRNTVSLQVLECGFIKQWNLLTTPRQSQSNSGVKFSLRNLADGLTHLDWDALSSYLEFMQL